MHPRLETALSVQAQDRRDKRLLSRSSVERRGYLVGVLPRTHLQRRWSRRAPQAHDRFARNVRSIGLSRTDFDTRVKFARSSFYERAGKTFSATTERTRVSPFRRRRSRIREVENPLRRNHRESLTNFSQKTNAKRRFEFSGDGERD